MATFTLAISEDLKKQIDAHPEIHWAGFLKQRLESRLDEFRKFEHLKSQGKI